MEHADSAAVSRGCEATILRGGTVYAPQRIGVADVAMGAGRILEIAPIISHGRHVITGTFQPFPEARS